MSRAYVPFYTSDFLAGTSGMTAATKGVYITLLCLMYESEAPLAQKWDTLARRCGCTPAAFKRAVETLQDDGKIDRLEEGLWSEKCDKHLEFRRERTNSAKAAAKKRWEKIQQKQGGVDASASLTQCQPEPEPKVKEEPNGSSKKKGSRLPEDWVLPRPWGRWAVEQGLPERMVRDQAERFRDYWLGVSGAKGVKRDWLATWRNWVRRALEDAGPQRSLSLVPQVKKSSDGTERVYEPGMGWVQVHQ